MLLIFIGICGVFVSAQSHRPKNVQTALRAKWEGTPLLLEAGYDLFLILSLLISNLKVIFFSYFLHLDIHLLIFVVEISMGIGFYCFEV